MSTDDPTPQRRSTLLVVLVAAAVILAAAAVLVAVTTRDSGHDTATTPPTGPTAPITSVPGTSTATSTSGNATTPSQGGFGYQPLWPFGAVADAVAWQREANPGGHQPWHLDAGYIALMFTQQYLGYTGIDKTVKVSDQGEQAWVSVGFVNPNGATAVAAVIHLARIGQGADRPWEVVGTEDTTLTLTTPAYGAAVHSPIAVGGSITGVDESLRVQVRGLGHEQPVGQSSPMQAGGTNAAWKTSIPINGGCPGTLTLAVATGGHVADVERFAVTGVHC